MTSVPSPGSWAQRAVDRSPIVQRSRSRSLQQAQVIVDAARRLALVKGQGFTTQELVKEAGIALQTFYRHFAGKDQLLLAVIEDVVAESCVVYEEQARELSDPVARLRHYVMSVVRALDRNDPADPRFIVSEHWRLHQLYPDELAVATRPFTDLVLRELREAQSAGLLAPADAEYDAWLVAELTMVVYHHYAFATAKEPAEVIGERLWRFCLGALGGTPSAGAAPVTG